MLYTESFRQDNFTPKRFESDHVITLHGTEIPYHTVCEDNVFYNKEGKPIASIFSYSYFRKDAENQKERPVIFCYNGGPGSSCVYVHAGFMGPRRMAYGEPDRPTAFGPWKVIDNPDCPLDDADLVFVDPVGTGYGVLIDESESKTFYGIEEDAEALLTFIEAWTKRYNRGLSPKYLVGESYGCTRSATAAGIAATGGKEREYGIAFDGIVMIGNTVTVGKYFAEGIPVEPSVLGFPTYAGVNWFHHHPTDQTVEEFVKEAKAFADTEYVLALYRGESLSEAEKEHIIERVSYYTGVSREYLLRNGLKIDDDTYRQEVLKKEGKAVSRYDGRVTRPLLSPAVDEEKKALWDDATADRYDTYFYAALTGDILPGLNITLDRSYIMSTLGWKNWNNVTPAGTTAEQLRNAMTRRPGMRTFFANGWFDLCTEFGYVFHTLDHAGLPKDRVYVKGYPSGHMIYLGEENVKALLTDVHQFILGKDPTR
ncbi:MAG: hypothetical protein LKK26_04410 [Solobacterium sp.]|jgi:carboxypeptidase C (cathepsin A)|nr:hypothetical protein [Solobacterium sp.]